MTAWHGEAGASPAAGPRAVIIAALRSLISRVRAHVGLSHGRPACDRTEREARTAISMPAQHPEHITRELPAAEETWLAAVAADLWPDDEYTEIIEDTRREDR